MESTQVKKKKLNPETIVVVVILAIIIVLFALFMRDIMIPLFKMQMNNDLDGASELVSALSSSRRCR